MLSDLEDDSVLADGLTRSLRQSGYVTDCVGNGQEADSALSTQDFDLLILDLDLPKMSGLEVLRRLRARDSRLPVLMLTGLDDEVSINRAYQVGATDFFVKSQQWSLLAGRLRYLLRSDNPGGSANPWHTLVRQYSMAGIGDTWNVSSAVLSRPGSPPVGGY